jgi:hypothetical protein
MFSTEKLKSCVFRDATQIIEHYVLPIFDMHCDFQEYKFSM